MTAPAQGGSTASSAGPRGSPIFWAALFGFVLHGLATLVAPGLAPGLVARAAPVLAYVLLGAFALSLGYVSGVVFSAVRARAAPPRGDVLRALL
ncbi:MAG TPA: hypothetical protein VFP65_13715, partial [Anaeromyxobacteraceae bacterium]|nr:hypothetical protein [Anaeromyxobacteraceae bacterium]